MKQYNRRLMIDIDGPAAFRRLCVETQIGLNPYLIGDPAAFRRLCVETAALKVRGASSAPAAFRRLCVETNDDV